MGLYQFVIVIVVVRIMKVNYHFLPSRVVKVFEARSAPQCNVGRGRWWYVIVMHKTVEARSAPQCNVGWGWGWCALFLILPGKLKYNIFYKWIHVYKGIRVGAVRGCRRANNRFEDGHGLPE